MASVLEMKRQAPEREGEGQIWIPVAKDCADVDLTRMVRRVKIERQKGWRGVLGWNISVEAV